MRAQIIIGILVAWCIIGIQPNTAWGQKNHHKHSLLEEVVVLTLKGNAYTGENTKLENIEVLLYLDGEEVEHFTTEGAKPLKISLLRDKTYTLILKKEGFSDSVILIYTTMPACIANDGYELDFDVEMYHETNSNPEEYNDLPRACVRYMPALDRFNISERYLEFKQKLKN